MKRITFQDRLRYWFDNTLARGPIALIGWLSLITLVLILLISVGTWLVGADPEGRPFNELLWVSFMHAMDAGALGGDTGSWQYLLLMLLGTLGGIFVFSVLIGILTTGIEGQLEELRKGRSFVAEEGHTVILGWSSQVFTIISELQVANANQRRSVIAILADKDKVEMEEEVRARVAPSAHTLVVCRSGSSIDLADLEIVNPHAARSIIVLSPETDDPDAHVIKCILALTNNPRRRPEPYHIVAVIHDESNLDAARLVGRDEAQLVLAGDLIARIAAQTCRQSGLSVAYIELLDFGGDEIYFHREPALVGQPFSEALLAFEDSSPIGIQKGGGEVTLLPPLDTLLAEGDKLIVIAEDDDRIMLAGEGILGIDASAIRDAIPEVPQPERTLILGWNARGMTIVRELDNYVAPGSEVTVAAEMGDPEAAAGLFSVQPFDNLRVTYQRGDTKDRRFLEGLAVETYQHIIVLSYSDALDAQRADAHTLITLLHLRDLSERSGRQFSIVSEMLDTRNRELAEVTRADDFIISDRMLSLMLAQVSENRHLAPVFQDLFDPEGAELYLRPATGYVQTGRPITFSTVIESARRRGEIAVGYRRFAQAYNPDLAYGVVINPSKSRTIAFDPEDRIIVLAEG